MIDPFASPIILFHTTLCEYFVSCQSTFRLIKRLLFSKVGYSGSTSWALTNSYLHSAISAVALLLPTWTSISIGWRIRSSKYMPILVTFAQALQESRSTTVVVGQASIGV